MAEDLTLRSKDGKTAPGRGELTRYTQTRRATLAAVFGGIGLLFGLATFVPGPHMCVTWIFPFVGAFLALRAWWNEAELNSIEGACPACEAEGLTVQGGQVMGTGPLFRSCPNCMAPLEIEWAPPAETGAEG